MNHSTESCLGHGRLCFVIGQKHLTDIEQNAVVDLIPYLTPLSTDQAYLCSLSN